MKWFAILVLVYVDVAIMYFLFFRFPYFLLKTTGGCVHTDVTSCCASCGEVSDYDLVLTPKGQYLLKEIHRLPLASS